MSTHGKRIEEARRAYVAALGTKDEAARRAELETRIQEARMPTRLWRCTRCEHVHGNDRDRCNNCHGSRRAVGEAITPTEAREAYDFDPRSA